MTRLPTKPTIKSFKDGRTITKTNITIQLLVITTTWIMHGQRIKETTPDNALTILAITITIISTGFIIWSLIKWEKTKQYEKDFKTYLQNLEYYANPENHEKEETQKT